MCYFLIQIVVSLVNGRPNAMNFSYADELQEFTRATDVQLRLLRTKTLLGHLMAIARQDPTVTRRVFILIFFFSAVTCRSSFSEVC